MNERTVEPKLAGKWKGAGDANVDGLFELMKATAAKNDWPDTLADRLIGAARYLDIHDDEIEAALWPEGRS